jgi:putative endonuclease
MRKEYEFYVYIVASKSRTLYIGVTNALLFRVSQHREGQIEGFTQRYKVNRLVYFERFQYIENAIHREKELKGWLRVRKIALIESLNPTWEDLFVAIQEGRWKDPRANVTLKFSPAQTKAGPSPTDQDDNSKD